MENCKKYINVNNGTINITLDQDISWSLVVYGNFGLSQYYGKGSATVQTICLEPTAYGYVTFATSDDECANAKCIVSVSDVNGYESFNVSTTYTQFNCKDSIARIISNRNIIIKDSFEDFSVSGNGSTMLTLTSKNNDTFKHVVKVYNADNENEFVIVVVEQKSCRDTSSDSCLLDIVNINQSFSGDKNYNVTNWTNGSLSFQLSTNANDITYPTLSSKDYKISCSGNLYTITPLPKNSDEKYSQQTLTFISKECGSTSISFQYDNSSQGGNGNYFYIEYINGEKQEGTNTKTASLSRDKDNVSIKSKLNYAISNNSSNNCTIKRNGNTFTFIVKDVTKDANGTLVLKQDTTNDTITVTFTYDSSSSSGGGG